MCQGRGRAWWPSVTYYCCELTAVLTNEASGGCIIFWNQLFLFQDRKEKATPPCPQKELPKGPTMPDIQRRHC